MELRNHVDFFNHCKKCVHKSKDESEEPCATCLSTPERINSRKPIQFEEQKEAKKDVGKRRNNRRPV